MRKRIQKPVGTKQKILKAVPDTSAIIDGKLNELINKGELDGAEIIIPQIVMGELQAQASKGRETGFTGLSEIKKLRDIAAKHKITLKFIGERPSYEDILLAKSGRIDALIQDVAKKEKAVLITADLPQALVAEAEGLKVKYFEHYKKGKKITLDSMLTPDTMSLHLKEGVIPYAKKGRPGAIRLVPIRDKPLSGEEIDLIIKEVMEKLRYEEDTFMEISELGASVIQSKDLRIAITKPPFSSGLEVTVVRPIVKLSLSDYKLSEKLKRRLAERAEGILIAGPPGSGKSTFAAGVAEFFQKKKKAVVKTMESPRDLQVPPEITQYAPINGNFAKTSDMLLLVRPDYTIFDEIRKPKDFEIFADMRLAGIGMVGVVHASNAIDAIQRFIGKVDIGVIPHVIDTVIFIRDGKIEKVYELSLTVRTPFGMTDEDLARPLVEIRNFETQKLEYEIYSYGEEKVVIPVKEEKKHALLRLAEERIMQEIKKFDRYAELEFISDNKVSIKVKNEAIPKIIGREGKTIKSIEEKLGLSIELRPAIESLGKQIKHEVTETGAYVVLVFDKRNSGKNANVYIDNEYLFTATIGKSGQIRVSKSSDLGKKMLAAIAAKKKLKVLV